MLKDSDQLGAADMAYRQALALADKADTQLQHGHLMKRVGNRAEAMATYRRALERDPHLPGAVQELAEAGSHSHLVQRFVAQQQAGEIESFLTLTQTLADMRAQLERLSQTLPEMQSRVAFPLGCYDAFRTVFPIPAPPQKSNATFTILLLADRESLATVFAQIGAIQAQSHPHWRLHILGADPERQRVVELASAADPRIHWCFTTADGPVAERAHVDDDSETWILLLAQGAMLDPHATAWFAQAAAWSNASAFVCDEEVGSKQRGRIFRASPVLRAVMDYDTLLEANIYGETIAIKAKTFSDNAHLLPETSNTAARHVLLLHLAAHEQVGHVPFPLIWRERSAIAPSDGVDGIEAYLGQPDAPENLVVTHGSTPMWQPRSPEAVISVIIPTRDNAADLRAMVNSLRQTAAAPNALDIMVADNGTRCPEDLGILAELAADNVRVFRREMPFNWSLLNNQLVLSTTANLFVFANDDMRMVSPSWDVRLRGLLERPEVGAVGARLLWKDDTVQHAGVLFGWKGSVIHYGDDNCGVPEPSLRSYPTRSVGAVTGAFLATTRARFNAVGGFDAQGLPVAYSDIDYALKLRAIGLRIVWSPAITLYHHESKSRAPDATDPWRAARNAAEHSVMETRWGAAMDTDPGAHPFWQAAARPFKLLGMPPTRVIQAHITRTGSGSPWRP